MYCPKCGTQNRDENNFCRRCGYDFSERKQEADMQTMQGSELKKSAVSTQVEHSSAANKGIAVKPSKKKKVIASAIVLVMLLAVSMAFLFNHIQQEKKEREEYETLLNDWKSDESHTLEQFSELAEFTEKPESFPESVELLDDFVENDLMADENQSVDEVLNYLDIYSPEPELKDHYRMLQTVFDDTDHTGEKTQLYAFILPVDNDGSVFYEINYLEFKHCDGEGDRIHLNRNFSEQKPVKDSMIKPAESQDPPKNLAIRDSVFRFENDEDGKVCLKVPVFENENEKEPAFILYVYPSDQNVEVVFVGPSLLDDRVTEHKTVFDKISGVELIENYVPLNDVTLYTDSSSSSKTSSRIKGEVIGLPVLKTVTGDHGELWGWTGPWLDGGWILLSDADQVYLDGKQTHEQYVYIQDQERKAIEEQIRREQENLERQRILEAQERERQEKERLAQENRQKVPQFVAYKPVIYLYPQQKTDVSVVLDYHGELYCTYPLYKNGWNVTAFPDGHLKDEKGKEYRYLYWEGISEEPYSIGNDGFCIKGSESREFLEKSLEKLGLNRDEANEFIIFWLPKLEANEWNLISFDTTEYEKGAPLKISPKPDTLIRVFMTFKASDHYVKLTPQKLTAPERKGFTVVEWGGSSLSEGKTE